MKRKTIIGIIVILIAAGIAGYGYWRTHPSSFSFNSGSKGTNSPSVKVPRNKSTKKATSTSDTSSSSLNQMKDDAKSFYQLIYNKEYDQAEKYMTSDFADSLKQAVDQNQSNDASVAKDISDDYEAKVGFRKSGKTYKVFSFSAQDPNMNNGGYAGSSQKGQ